MSNYPIYSPKKLIEVALPLDAINAESSKEKNNPFIRKHPRSMHTWWARRPFTAARALIFAQLVNDPGFQHGEGFRYGRNKRDAAIERKRLFDIMERLVKWENTNNTEVLEEARVEIARSWREVCDLNKNHPDAKTLFDPTTPPALHDPFCGGGAIPVEAQRLGVTTFATDINPVAVLINRAMVEIPAKFKDISPVNPGERKKQQQLARDWSNTNGLAADVSYYAKVVKERSLKKIAELYPDIPITEDMIDGRPDLVPYVGQSRPLVAFIRARTVESPNPAFRSVWVPLISTYVLSSGSGKEAYIEPVVNGKSYTFQIRLGKIPESAKSGTKLARGGNFRCLVSSSPIEASYIRAQGQQGRLRTCLIAIVAEGNRRRLYLPPLDQFQEDLPDDPSWYPEGEMPVEHRAFTPAIYGLGEWKAIFTRRQLFALNTIFDTITEVQEEVKGDAIKSGVLIDPELSTQYAGAIATYLALATSRWADFSNTICSWNSINQNIRVMFARQAVQMSWDFAELPPFGPLGPWSSCVEANVEALGSLSLAAPGVARQADAADQSISKNKIVVTDPPYYDNVPYADLSDFFYPWLRRALKAIHPDLFATIATPKDAELVATPFRHGGRVAAEEFFLTGMTNAMKRLAETSHKAFPIAIYYAFKQSETTNDSGTSSTGWETFLEAVLNAGFQIVGTWPVRTEKQGRSRSNDSNALASSIVLICRSRSSTTAPISRRAFIRELNDALPSALEDMISGDDSEHSPVAPVDLSQAIIGPGMAVFSRYPAVLEADGSPMTVKTALQLINRFLAEEDFDADTQFCLRWFEQHGWEAGQFGEADVLARAKGTSVEGVKQAGVVSASSGSVRLYRWKELEADWDPSKDSRIPIWQVLHQLILAYVTHGESGAAQLYAATVSKAEAARQLAYRLYTLCERRNWAEDARAYNEVVMGWSGIESAAATKMPAAERQGTLFASEEIR